MPESTGLIIDLRVRRVTFDVNGAPEACLATDEYRMTSRVYDPLPNVAHEPAVFTVSLQALERTMREVLTEAGWLDDGRVTITADLLEEARLIADMAPPARGFARRTWVARALRQSPNETLSGPALAEALGITRNAVAKHVRNLRRAGHVIVATKKGYAYCVATRPRDGISCVNPRCIRARAMSCALGVRSDGAPPAWCAGHVPSSTSV